MLGGALISTDGINFNKLKKMRNDGEFEGLCVRFCYLKQKTEKKLTVLAGPDRRSIILRC